MKKKLINAITLLTVTTCLFLTFLISYGRISITASVGYDLLGYKIYLDPGHGGWDNGASSSGVLEDEINLNVSLAILENLVERGAIVEISRIGDYDLASLYANNRKREDLLKRVQAIKEFQPDLFISIHVNSYFDSAVYGAQVFYRSKDDESKLAAERIQDQLNLLNKTAKAVKKGDFYLLNNVSYNGIFIESGFITNSTDRRKLQDPTYRKKMAISIGDGIADYIYKL